MTQVFRRSALRADLQDLMGKLRKTPCRDVQPLFYKILTFYGKIHHHSEQMSVGGKQPAP